jgi:hypothetical protein
LIQREEKESGEVVKDTTLWGRQENIFPVSNDHRQFPLVLLVEMMRIMKNKFYVIRNCSEIRSNSGRDTLGFTKYSEFDRTRTE